MRISDWSPDVCSSDLRVRNNHELDPIVGAYMAERTQEECLEIFEKAGVTVGAVADVAQLAEHPYPLDRSVIVSLPDADTGRLAMHKLGSASWRGRGCLSVYI